ncbi:MAG: phosphoglucosamine mutase [Alphaproteobacteria bacterium]
MKKKYFGTDGIRGKSNKFPIERSFLFKLAIAICNSKSNVKKILIGRDTRESGSKVENFLYNGFCSNNIECHSIGVASTPMVSFYTKKLKYDFGIVISASHNPYYDNGIKIFKKNGEKLSDYEELKIERILDKLKVIPKFNRKIKKKKINFEDYKIYLKKRFPRLTNINLKIVMDCANGAVFKFAPNFFNDYGAKVISYSIKPNGVNINKECGAMFPERLSKLTQKHKADIGLSFDGDADRVLISDNNGKILDGDVLLAAIIKFNNLENKNKIRAIVSTKMSNLSFRDYLKKFRIKFYLSKVGDRYVIEKMKEKKIVLGGEPSGHIIFSNNGYCGDGILSALSIINIVVNSNINLSKFVEGLFEKNIQRLVNLKLKKEPNIILNHSIMKKLLPELSKRYKNVDFLIRKSGTENLLRIMVQSKNKSDFNTVLKILVENVKKIDA